MAHIEVRARPQPSRRRECEPASSRVAAVRSGGISPQQQAQMPWLQRNASVSGARLQRLKVAARRQYRRDRCPPPQSLAVGARHKPEPSAVRSEEHTSELQSRLHLVCRLLLEKKKWTDEAHT